VGFVERVRQFDSAGSSTELETERESVYGAQAFRSVHHLLLSPSYLAVTLRRSRGLLLSKERVRPLIKLSTDLSVSLPPFPFLSPLLSLSFSLSLPPSLPPSHSYATATLSEVRDFLCLTAKRRACGSRSGLI
jgi:hypothetical protein